MNCGAGTFDLMFGTLRAIKPDLPEKAKKGTLPLFA